MRHAKGNSITAASVTPAAAASNKISEVLNKNEHVNSHRKMQQAEPAEVAAAERSGKGALFAATDFPG
jgi:hypothetical protein